MHTAAPLPRSSIRCRHRLALDLQGSGGGGEGRQWLRSWSRSWPWSRRRPPCRSERATSSATASSNHSSSRSWARSRRSERLRSAAGNRDTDLLSALGAQVSSQSLNGITSLLQRLATVVGASDPPESFPPKPASLQYDCALEFLDDPLAVLEKIYKSGEPLVHIVFGGERMLVVNDSALAKEVLSNSTVGGAWKKRGTAIFPGPELVGEGLLVADDQTWRRLRQLVNPAFSSVALRSYGYSMLRLTEVLLDSYKGSSGIDRNIYEDMNQLTLKIATKCLFGEETPMRSNDVIQNIADTFRFLVEKASLNILFPDWFPTLPNARFYHSLRQLDNHVYQIIAQQRKHMRMLGPDGSPDVSIISLLMQSSKDSASSLTTKEIRNQVLTFLVAGQETSAIAISWTLSLLAERPDVVVALREEIQACIGHTDGPFDETAAESLLSACLAGDLKLLESCVLESMRLYPPAYLIGRCNADEPTVLGGFSIPRNTTALISPYLLHRQPSHWEDSESFVPERWISSPRSLSYENPHYAPFGLGPRSCVGMGFALLESSLVVALFIQRFDFSLVGGLFPKAGPTITLRQKDGVRMDLEPAQPLALRTTSTPRAVQADK